MFCPHCHNKIPDGSNICPLCYANLAGMKPPAPKEAAQAASGAPSAQDAPRETRPRTKKNAYTKGSRGSRRSADRTPLLIAFGLIVIHIVINAMIIRSMVGAGEPGQIATQEPPSQTENTPGGGNFLVFGATPEPQTTVTATPEPAIEITPSPSPAPEFSYTTLRKGSQGREVVNLQQALASLGFLNSAADGNFGTGTETAVKNFQSANGLEADGIAGRMTLEALYSQSTITPIPETTAAPGDILDLPG